MSIVHGIFFEEKFIFLLLLLRCCDVVMYPVYKYHLDTRRCGPRQQSLDKTFIISFTKHRNMTQTSSKGDPASILCHYEKTCIGINSFRNSINLFQNGIHSDSIIFIWNEFIPFWNRFIPFQNEFILFWNRFIPFQNEFIPL